MENTLKYKKIGQQNKWEVGGIGKMPPQAVELEEVVLGAILSERDAFMRTNVLISDSIFYKQAHANIYNACKQLYDKSEPIDLMTVKNQLEKNGELEICGGLKYLAELTQKVTSSANMENHCFILKEKFAKRELIVMAQKIQQLAYEDTEDIFETIDFVNDSFTDISENLIINQEKTIQAQFAQMLLDIENAKANDGIVGIPSKFIDIQNKLKGYRRSNLIILGARPSMGKSLWMLNEAIFQCQVGYKVAIFSMEMTASEQLTRLVSSLTQISANKIEVGDLSTDDFTQIHKTINAFPVNYLSIFEKSKMNVRYIKTCIQTLKRKGKIDIAYIDHLGLIKPERKDNRNNEIGEITGELKSFAKEMDIPIVVLSQLNRESVKGTDKRPKLEHLRESGNIEQDANVVMFFHREDYYLDTPEKILDYQNNIVYPQVNMIGKGEISIAKNRAGKLGSAITAFDGETATIDNIYDKHEVVIIADKPQQTHNFAHNKTLDQIGTGGFEKQEVNF